MNGIYDKNRHLYPSHIRILSLNQHRSALDFVHRHQLIANPWCGISYAKVIHQLCALYELLYNIEHLPASFFLAIVSFEISCSSAMTPLVRSFLLSSPDVFFLRYIFYVMHAVCRVPLNLLLTCSSILDSSSPSSLSPKCSLAGIL